MPSAGDRIAVLAPAKVNLHLRVLERMADGYHRLETLFQAIDLFDRIELEVVPGTDVDLEVRGADVGPAEDNLVTRAVRAFRGRAGSEIGVRVLLHKTIPAGAGLGGGSSDAGATLRALDALHGGILGEAKRSELGAELGADVAFFAGSAGLALGEGRGAVLTPLPALPPTTLIVGAPDVHVATGPAYGALSKARAEGGTDAPTPRVSEPASLAREGNALTWELLSASAVNDFESVVPALHPPVARALDALRQRGSPLALLSGSGGAVFGLPWSEDPAACVRTLRGEHPEVTWHLVQTLATLPEPTRVEP